MAHERKESIDLGLAVLRVVNVAGEPLGSKDIAEICRCARGTITAIERRGLAKIAKPLREFFALHDIDPQELSFP